MKRYLSVVLICLLLLGAGFCSYMIRCVNKVYEYKDEFVKAKVYTLCIDYGIFIAEIKSQPSQRIGLVLRRTFASQDSAIKFVEVMRTAYYNFTGQKPTWSKVGIPRIRQGD